MGQQAKGMNDGCRKARPFQAIQRVPVAVILDDIVQQGRADGFLVLHLRGQVKRMEHIRISPLVHIVLVGIIHDAARSPYKFGIDHEPAAPFHIRLFSSF